MTIKSNKKNLFLNVFILFLCLFFLIILFFSYEKYYLFNKNKFSLDKCSELSFVASKQLKPQEFSKFDININIPNQKKWKKIITRNAISVDPIAGNYSNQGSVNAEIILTTLKGVKCILKAKIKPHGDFSYHHKDDKTIFELPSIKVDLLDGHIFGIVKFILFKPKTRNYGNEVFITTFLQEADMLAPRTALVSVNYRKNNNQFIFQERIVKELLEYNNLIEGPIYKGDERFVFKYETYNKSGISKHKLSNGKWASLNRDNYLVASHALEILNLTNYYYTSDVIQEDLIDYYTSQSNDIFKNYFNHLPKFDALAFATHSVHSLSRDERRFYYDPLKKIFLPIYYDGIAHIVDQKNKIDSSFENISKNWRVLYRSDYEIWDSKVSYSAIAGIDEAFLAVNNMNIQKLHGLLINRGLEISYQSLEKIIKIIKKNILSLKNFPENKLIKVTNDIQYPLKNINAYNKNINSKYLFLDENQNFFQVCDLLLENCDSRLFDLQNQSKALEQLLKDENGDELIFQGKINSFLDKDFSQFLEIKNNIIDINENTSLIVFGKIKVNINYDSKYIEIIKNIFSDRIVFKNGTIENWTIKYNDFTSNKNYDYINRDHNGLSGCLNFYDIELKNINIYINGSSCEDALNLVRVQGNLSDIQIINSSYDAIDLDFSKIKIDQVNIEEAGNDCLDLSFGNYSVVNFIANNCGDKAISVGENSNFLGKNLFINNSKFGIVAKDFSELNILNGKINNTDTCLYAFSKKQEFSGSSIVGDTVNCTNSNNKYIQAKGSIIKINQ